MFWNSAATSSTIDTVLDKPDVSLRTILEQDEVLQELRAMNKKLVEFLTRPENITGMIELVTTEPPDDLPLAAQYKLANVACEVLTCDNNFAEKMTAEKGYLEKLFYFFRDNPAPINPLLASYTCRVISEIFTRKLDQNWYSYQLNLIQIMGYLQAEPGVVEWLLNHLDCSAVSEFLYKLIMNVEGPDMRNSLYFWMVDREKIIVRLMEKMTRAVSDEVHANVSRLVGDLLFAFQDDVINSSQDRSADADPFLIELRSPETISTLLGVLFEPDAICETSVMHGLDLVLALVGVTRKCPRQSGRNDALDEDNEELQISEGVKLDILSIMPTLLKLLECPVDQHSIRMSYGILEKPVGLGRLAIAKFLAHLFTLNDDGLNMGMIESGVLKQLLDLFWENPWNNFLHRYVCKILSCIAKATNSPGAPKYLLDIGVLSKILEVFETKDLKVGFRGHLAKVAFVWGEAAEGDGPVREIMKKLEEDDGDFYSKWDAFYSDTLDNYLSEERVLLAGVHPPASGGLISSPAIPYDTDSMWEGSSGGLADFDISADSFTGGEGSDGSKARSLFELFCSAKLSGLRDDDEELNDDSPEDRVNKDSFDLTGISCDSPDPYDDDENTWQGMEGKVHDPPFEKGGGDEDEEKGDGEKSLTTLTTVSFEDPWSSLGPEVDSEGFKGAGDPWSNEEGALGDGSNSSQNAGSMDWAKFDSEREKQGASTKKGAIATTTGKSNPEDGPTPIENEGVPGPSSVDGPTPPEEEDEWASFESALSSTSLNTEAEGDKGGDQTPATCPSTSPPTILVTSTTEIISATTSLVAPAPPIIKVDFVDAEPEEEVKPEDCGPKS